MFGAKLKKLRERENLSRDEFAKKIGITYAALSKYELDLRQPDFETLTKIADYFEVSTDYLLDHDVSGSKNTDSLTPYQKEVIDFFNSREDLFFHDHPGDIMDALEQFEIYYEIWKKQQQNKNK
ncbi:helix-turn-helix domain-containing protein [Chryseomicrobium aureum]|uniref:helix-turn-helix domain-containing protein n=1 Tax=Chryseomicrobium aureum TaxID=1441723 RepID=UPI00370D9EDD